MSSGVVGAAYVTSAGPFAEQAPELTDFETTDAQCSAGEDAGVAIELREGDDASHLTVEDGVEVPDLAHGVGNASVERTGPSEYTLSVETHDAGAGTVGAQCLGTVRYTANVTIPEKESFTVMIQVDGDTVHTVHADPGGSGAGSTAGGTDG